jgi:transcriptional regulator with XRE-family HTH domain
LIHEHPFISAAVGRRLRERRVDAGVSLSQLATRVGLAASALRDIEEGRVAPSVGTLARIAGRLGVTLPDLVREAEKPPPPKPVAVMTVAEIGRAIVELPDGGGDKLAVVEAAAIRHAVEACKGNKSRAAQLLGMVARLSRDGRGGWRGAGSLSSSWTACHTSPVRFGFLKQHPESLWRSSVNGHAGQNCVNQVDSARPGATDSE